MQKCLKCQKQTNDKLFIQLNKTIIDVPLCKDCLEFLETKKEEILILGKDVMVKIIDMINIIPDMFVCAYCTYDSPHILVHNFKFKVRCSSCLIKGPEGETQTETIEKWNNMQSLIKRGRDANTNS